MMVILEELKPSTPLPSSFQKFLNDGTLFGQNSPASGEVSRAGRGCPAVRIDDGVYQRIDIHRHTASMGGGPLRSGNKPVIECRRIVVHHGGVIGPAVLDNGNDPGNGKSQFFQQIEERNDILPNILVNDKLSLVEAIVKRKIADIQEA